MTERGGLTAQTQRDSRERAKAMVELKKLQRERSFKNLACLVWNEPEANVSIAATCGSETVKLRFGVGALENEIMKA